MQSDLLRRLFIGTTIKPRSRFFTSSLFLLSLHSYCTSVSVCCFHFSASACVTITVLRLQGGQPTFWSKPFRLFKPFLLLSPCKNLLVSRCERKLLVFVSSGKSILPRILFAEHFNDRTVKPITPSLDIVYTPSMTSQFATDIGSLLHSFIY